ncbi:flavin reductase family protein [Deinococcus yavapaiensis]|uniref:Flavin reductase (DIM6/NTAB) family NADH-FMN oxidoreductase RutF n=1 Tax=Deinococcus yavapaiensis KR-236 TaxID=694435 RepID=A0A318SSM8_9DEIO|nr:flavin reductase family protein [Deinococcus yavapaiensis]PYE56216.1 flavin reductase (DIM6/NTAB) family NADH-FMN oxidoreductase RutF [Deinococcus yavapaiensis KR-236]
MTKLRTPRFFGYYPGTVALVTARHQDDRNVMSAGWHTALSVDPPLYGVLIGRERATHPLVTASGRFGVNFLNASHARVVQGAGVLSLADGADKFETFGLREDADETLVLEAAYLTFVCDVADIVTTGDHDLFVGRVRDVVYDPRAYDEQFLLRDEAPVYLGRGTYVKLDTRAERVTFAPESFVKVTER